MRCRKGGLIRTTAAAALLVVACATPAGPASTTPTPPTSWYVATVPTPTGCREVGPEIAGVKVYLVQQALGLVGHRERYDDATASAVRAFQRSHALPVTGRVDVSTWDALGTGQPFCVDRFVVQPALAPTAPRAAHVAAAERFAAAQVGLPYVWGGAGPVGYDCSGLVLQALHAGGVVVAGITVDRHVEVDFATAAALYTAPDLTQAPLAERQPGDLVFWGTPTVTHVALYLGDDWIVEAVRPQLRTASLWTHGDPLPMVARPFPATPPRDPSPR